MSKPLFVYTLACESCGETLTKKPQTQAAITELKRQHAEHHARREAQILAAFGAPRGDA